MHSNVNPEVARLFGILRSQIEATPHPSDGLDAWRSSWVKARRLVDQIDQIDEAGGYE